MEVRGSMLTVMLMLMVSANNAEDLLAGYGVKKILSSCLGEAVVSQYLARQFAAANICKNRPMGPAYSDPSEPAANNRYSAGANSLSGGTNRYSVGTGANYPALAGSALGGTGGPVSVPRVPNSPMTLKGFDWGEFFQRATAMTGGGGAGQTQFIPIPVVLPAMPSNRAKRRAGRSEKKYFSAERVRTLSEKMAAHVSNQTCILQEMDHADSEGNVRFDTFKREITEMVKDIDLQEDLLQILQDCQAHAMCTPTSKIRAPLTPGYVQNKVFTKCFIRLELYACIKKDLRERSEDFDLSALDDTLQGADNDEKMLAILWASSALEPKDFF